MDNVYVKNIKGPWVHSSWNRQWEMWRKHYLSYEGKQQHLFVPLFLLKLAFIETRICGKWALAAELGVFRNMLNHCGEIFYCVS